MYVLGMYVWLLCKIYGNLLHNVKYKLQCTHTDAHARIRSLCLSLVEKCFRLLFSGFDIYISSNWHQISLAMCVRIY